MNDEAPLSIDALEVRHVLLGGELYREVYTGDICIGKVKIDAAALAQIFLRRMADGRD
jgi:hypothetical protein